MANARGGISKKLKSETDLQEVVHKWLLVTDEFDKWRHQLSEVIVVCTTGVPNEPCIGDQVAIANLRLLYDELMGAMRKLVGEVNRMEEREGLDLEQIVAHTNTIHQWSQKIRYALYVEARGAA